MKKNLWPRQTCSWFKVAGGEGVYPELLGWHIQIVLKPGKTIILTNIEHGMKSSSYLETAASRSDKIALKTSESSLGYVKGKIGDLKNIRLYFWGLHLILM